jgi:DNA-binding transcriptional LysR family regulator
MASIRPMNFAAFDLNLLRVFDALMRERSVTRAGEQIGLSQPAVSQALTRLRGLLDDQLFVRRGTEMAPTPRAEALAPAVREALAALELALTGDRRFDPAAAERTCTVLGSDFVSMLVMPELYARIAREAPGVRLRLVDTAWGPLEKLLQEDALDLAIERPLNVPDWVSREVLFVSPFAIIAANGHPALAARGVAPGAPIPLDLFCETPQALRSIDGGLGGFTDEALAKAGRERRVVLALPHFAAVAEAVARSDLIAAIPSQFAAAVADTLGLCVYQPPLAMGAPQISLYWHSRHDRNPAHAWLREHVRQACSRL